MDIDVTLLNITLTEESFSFTDSANQNVIDKQITTPFVLACIFFGFFVINCLIGTCFEIYNTLQEKKFKTLENEADGFISPENIQNVPKREERVHRPGCLNRFFLNFSVLKNTEWLLFGRSKDSDKNLEALNGLRVFSIGWVILGHTFYWNI